MKRFLTYGIIAIILLSSCTENKKIEEVAYLYSQAMANYDFSTAKQYATPQTCDITLRYFEEVILPHTDTNFIKTNTPATIKITKVHQTSDTTATVCFIKKTPSNQVDGTLDLVKRENVWKADVVIKIPAILNPQAPRRKIPFKELKKHVAQDLST